MVETPRARPDSRRKAAAQRQAAVVLLETCLQRATWNGGQDLGQAYSPVLGQASSPVTEKETVRTTASRARGEKAETPSPRTQPARRWGRAAPRPATAPLRSGSAARGTPPSIDSRARICRARSPRPFFRASRAAPRSNRRRSRRRQRAPDRAAIQRPSRRASPRIARAKPYPSLAPCAHRMCRAGIGKARFTPTAALARTARRDRGRARIAGCNARSLERTLPS